MPPRNGRRRAFRATAMHILVNTQRAFPPAIRLLAMRRLAAGIAALTARRTGALPHVLAHALVRGNGQLAFESWDQLSPAAVELGPRNHRVHAHLALNVVHLNAELDLGRVARHLQNYFRAWMGAFAPHTLVRVSLLGDLSRTTAYQLKDRRPEEAVRAR